MCVCSFEVFYSLMRLTHWRHIQHLVPTYATCLELIREFQRKIRMTFRASKAPFLQIITRKDRHTLTTDVDRKDR